MEKKIKLAKEIEQLMRYDDSDEIIAPSLLHYLSIEELEKIKLRILSNRDNLSCEDKEWLLQFKKQHPQP